MFRAYSTGYESAEIHKRIWLKVPLVLSLTVLLPSERSQYADVKGARNPWVFYGRILVEASFGNFFVYTRLPTPNGAYKTDFTSLVLLSSQETILQLLIRNPLFREETQFC